MHIKHKPIAIMYFELGSETATVVVGGSTTELGKWTSDVVINDNTPKEPSMGLADVTVA